MGMTILQAKQKLHENWMLLTTCGRDTELTQALSIAETVLGNYDDALKADLKAILVELQLEIEEMKSYESPDGQDLVMLADIGILFQQKIDKLKEK